MNKPALQDYFAKVASLPQRFGVYDCCTFIVESLLIGWDRDYRDALRYYDRKSAVKRLRQDGGLREAFEDVLGNEHLIMDDPPGTVAWFGDPGQKCVGLVMPMGIFVKANGCIHRFIMEDHRTGWRTD